LPPGAFAHGARRQGLAGKGKRFVRIERPAMAFRLLFSAALLALVAPAAPSIAADSGEAVWASSCRRCHRDVAAVVPEGDLQQAALELTAFLANHHAPDPAAREAVAAWLLDQARE